MAESIVSDIVVKLLEYMGKSAVEVIAPYFGGIHKLKELEQTMEMIQARLLDAERRGEGNSEALVSNWLNRLKLVLYRLEDLFEEVAMADQVRNQIAGGKLTNPVRNLFSCSIPLRINKKVGKEAKFIKEELKSITLLMDSLKFRVLPIEEHRVVDVTSSRETHSFVVEGEVIGRDKDRNKIVRMLLDPDHTGENVSVIPIVGIGGLGKTTLAQIVFNDKNVENHFEFRRWACISIISSLKELVQKILESIIDGDCHLSMEQLQSRLRQAVNDKRYLLVLDDVWHEDKEIWDDLRNLLCGGKPGSKIIVTSRSRVVAHIMGTREPYELEGLPRNKSWELFRKLAFKEGQEGRNPKLASIGKEIVKKCANVPLAIKSIACLLYSMDTEIEWESFKDKELRMMDQNKNNILLTLKLSYDRLPSELKQCFAYCSLFPKDHVFSKRNLIYLWIAQGFIWSSNGSPEYVGHQHFMQLVRRCFFQDVIRDEHGEITKCKMHSLVHDLAQHVARGETLLMDRPTQQMSDNIRHVSFCCGISVESLARILATKQIRTLLLLSNPTRLYVNEIFTSLRCLRALDLANANGITLPDSVGQLKHLRYLRLGGEIESLPECLCRLQNLQTLDLWSCRGLRELPRRFSKLINLRHFHGGFNQLIDLPPRFGQLTSLQALDEFIVGESNGLDALGSFDHLAGHLRIRFEKCRGDGLSEAVAGNLKDKKLTELTLSWSSLYGEPAGDAKEEEDELAMKCLQPPPSLESLSVLYWKGVKFPGWGMDEFPTLLPNLAHVLIRDCHRCERLLLLSQLPRLVSLHLWGLNTLEYIEISGDKREASFSAAYFPCLQFLKLQELPELKGWSRVEEEEHFDHEQQICYDENHQYLLLPPFFPRLSKLIMVNCPKLKSIPFAPMLEVLNADRIQGKLVKHLLHTEEETESPMTSLPSSSALSTLTWTQISKVQELESLTINPKLESLTIRGCRDLISLFVESPTSLWRLEIIRCGRLRDISGALQHLAILQILIIIDCEALEMGDIMDDDDDDGDDDGGRSINSKVGARSTVWQGLKSLHSLTLWNIPKLESHALQGLAYLTTLRELSIRDCPKLTALPESFCKLTSLQKLRIWRCPELERRCQGPNGQDWPLIQHIPYVRVVG